MRYEMILLAGILLSGCSSHVRQNYQIKTPDLTADTVHANKAPAPRSELVQCNRDLESLRTVDISQYRFYQAEYDSLMKHSAGFLTVKEDVSAEVAALARPRFQFALVDLCWRIKNALASTLIHQAGGEK
ncbi:hypothetical protein ACLEX4_19160 [Pseudescherichia vulneris]